MRRMTCIVRIGTPYMALPETDFQSSGQTAEWKKRSVSQGCNAAKELTDLS